MLVSLWATSGSVHALIVGSSPGIAPNTTVNPASYVPPVGQPDWNGGDPGFDNFALSGGYIYLGDGWVLSARHVGYNPEVGIQFQTPTGPVTFKAAGTRYVNNTYTLGPYYSDYGFPGQPGGQFAVSNRSSINLEGGGSHTLSPYTDLQLFRINGDPGLPSLTIASQPLPNDEIGGLPPSEVPELMMIGISGGRAVAETHWNVTGSSPNLTWTETTGAGDQQGYLSNGVGGRRWGTNRVADPAELPTEIVTGVVSNTAAVIPLQTGVGAIARDLIGNVTKYNRASEAGTTAFEAQAIGGDSGGAVFYKRDITPANPNDNNFQWELSGIINSVFPFEDQPGGTAVYGNYTVMTDLSYYNQSFDEDARFSIQDIMDSHPDYSEMGDVNLDGQVSGTGTGPVTSDDVTAFVQGWRFNNGTGQGNITSWTKGDLNRDGKTDAADFILLRGAFNGQVSGSIASLLMGAAVPEPSASTLALLAVGAFSCRRRRWARSFAVK